MLFSSKHEERLNELVTNQKRYAYKSDSDNENVYINPKSANFANWRKERKMLHILKLWRKAYNLSISASLVINLHIYLHTKFIYFGRQMLSTNQQSIQKKALKKKEALTFKFIIMPNSMLKSIWNFTMILLLIYTAIMTPLRSSFYDSSEIELKDVYHYMEIIIDYVFIADIFVNFLSAYQRKDGKNEMRLKKIAINYITGFLLIDTLASIPFSLLLDSGDAKA